MNATGSEQGLASIGLNMLAGLVMRIRVDEANPTEIHKIASQLNLPWLFLSCEIIRRLYPNQHIGFLGRDCYLMQKIYQTYFHFGCVYIPFSRAVVEKDADKAVEYLKNYNVDVLVDISSTGRTWETLCAKHPFNIRALIYSDIYFDKRYPKPVTPATFSCVARNSQIGPTNEVIEFFNCGAQGMLTSLDPLTYAQHEMPQLVAAIHQPVHHAMEHGMLTIGNEVDYMSIMNRQLEALTDKELGDAWTQYLLCICEQKNFANIVEDPSVFFYSPNVTV